MVPMVLNYYLQYIENFTRFRGSSEADVIDEISDVRNGLLLYKTLHGHLGRGNSAFIKVGRHVALGIFIILCFLPPTIDTKFLLVYR